MSGAFPTTPKFRAINFKDNRPSLVNQTLSGKKSARQIGGQYPFENLGADKAQTDILVNGVHSAQDATIAMDGFTASTTGVLKAGDLIKFASHTKTYMVQADADSNSSGEATIFLSPNTVASLADNEAVTVNTPSITVYLSTGELMYSTDTSGMFSISFDVREVIV